MRNAKIVCTLGPASRDRATIRALAHAGMAVARLNASHGSPADRLDLLERVREVGSELDRSIAVMLDLKGPEIRTATLPADERITYETGDTVRLVPGDDVSADHVGLTHSLAGVEAGDEVLLDDGRIELCVERVDGEEVATSVDRGGELASRKGVNVPGVDLGLEPVTPADEAELDLAVEQDVDFVAASFVRDGADVYAVSEAIENRGGEIPVIAKVERAGAYENLGGIVEAAYGVMVARGDLGVELPMEDVPMIQKRIVRRCREAGVPVITATEMLDSMVTATRPTRAEASDVANAVLDGTDAVMLSAETAVGDHPVRVVETMDRIIRQVEASGEYQEVLEGRVPAADESRTDALARSARYLARDVGAGAIVAATESGYTARKTAKFRPGIPVVASTPHDDIQRQLALSWGVQPVFAEVSQQGADAVIEKAVASALGAGVAESGDTVVVLCGMMTELEGANTTNMLKVHVAAEALTTGRVVVEGWATGPVSRTTDGDLQDVPAGVIIALDSSFDGEFDGDLSALSGIIAERSDMTGYPAMVARELGIPMVGGVDLDVLEAADVVTIDAERGVIYDGAVRTQDPSA